MDYSESVQQSFSRIQSLFRDYQELNEEKIDSYEGEIGDFAQRRAYEKKFKAKGNIAHSNLSFQRATDETTTNQQKDDLLMILNGLILDDSQLTAIEFDSDIFGRGRKRRQYFFQPGELVSVDITSASEKGHSVAMKDGKLKTIAPDHLEQDGQQPNSPTSPNKTRATTAGSEEGDMSAQEEEDFEAEMQRNKFVFESLVDKARSDDQVRVGKLKECLQRLKNKQKEMVFRSLDDFKKAHYYQRIKNRLLELDNLLVKNKALLAEKKYALQLKKAQSNISAEELRKRFEYETEQQVRHLLEQVEKRKHEVEELTRKNHGIEEEIEKLLKDMSLLLYDLEKEEKTQQQLHPHGGNPSKSKNTSKHDRSASPSHQITGLASTAQYDDISGIFEVFPFIQNNGAELTDDMIDQAVKVVEESELKLNTMKGMITLAEEDYVKKKATLSNLVKGEDNRANERLKKMCLGLEQKISSDEKRVELLENLIKGLKKDKQSSGGSTSSSATATSTAGSVGNGGATNPRHRMSTVMGAGGGTAMNKPRQSIAVTKNGINSSGVNGKDATASPGSIAIANVSTGNNKNDGSSKSVTGPATATVSSSIEAPPQTSFHQLLKQYLENSFLADVANINNNGIANSSSTVIDRNSSADSPINTTTPSISLSNDKLEEIINQYRIIAPHQVMKMSKSIEVFQDFAASKLHHINAIVPPSQHLTSLMSNALATVSNQKPKTKSTGGAASSIPVNVFCESTEEPGNRIENVPGTRPAEYVAPRQEDLVETVYFESYAYNAAVEQLNTIISMLLQWNGSSSNGKAELGMRTEEEELENVEALRHQINKLLEQLKGTYKDGQQVQRVYKELSNDFNEQLRVCDRLRSELLREVEGLQWSSMLQPGQYQVEMESCKNRIAMLKQQLKAMEERVSSRRKTNIRLSQLLTDKRIYPTDLTTTKFW